MKSFQSLRPLALRSTIPLRIIRPSQLGLRTISRTTGEMTSQRDDSIPHELRTAAEPRQNRLHPVRLSHIEQINPSVRLLQFALPPQENNVWFYFSFLACYLFIYICPYLPYLVNQARLSHPGLVVLPAPLDIYAPHSYSPNHIYASTITHTHSKDGTDTFYRITINSHSASSRANGLMSIFPPSPKRVGSLSPPPRQIRKYYHRQRLL
jgi:hypothetical protein